MQIQIQFTRESIEAKPGPASPEAGARVEFCGRVRRLEADHAIRALEYEAYEPMALRLMREGLEQLSGKYPCHSVEVIHRLGEVPVGDAAIYVAIEASHRGEAFGLLAEFMDYLKRDVPIWKARALAD